MEFTAPQQWENCPGIGLAGRAFVTKWLELFHRLTIDTYRVRHLNVRLVFEELSMVIREVSSLGTEILNVRDVSLEALRLLRDDPVVEQILPKRQHYYSALSHPLIDGKMIHPGLTVLVEQIRMTLTDRYRETVLNALRNAILATDVELTLRLTSALASDLIGEGYDLRHLHWRGDYFRVEPSRPFIDKLDELLARFRRPNVTEYTVAFRLVFNSREQANDLPTTISRMTLSTHLPRTANRTAEEYGKEDPLFRYASVEVKATDPFAAARIGASELTRALDLLQFARPRADIHILKSSLVDWGTPGAITVPTALELLGPMRVAKEELEARVQQVSLIARDDRISESTRDRLASGLRYLRRGLTDPSPDGQFTNLWVGLETVAGGAGRTSMLSIRERVSTLIGLRYPRRILNDARENIFRLRIDMDADLRRAILGERDRATALINLWTSLIEGSTVRDRLISKIQDPLLHNRLQTVAASLGTAEAIRRAILRNAEDVSWHVQRMYRVRNAVVHGGVIPGDLTHIASHLATYLWAILRVLIQELATPTGLTNIEAIFEKYKWLYEKQLELLKEADKGGLDFRILIDPIVLWPTG